MATRAHSSPGIVRPFVFTWRAAINRLPAKKGGQTSKARPTRNHYFQPVHAPGVIGSGCEAAG